MFKKGKKEVFHELIFFVITLLVAAQQLPYSPFDRKVSQVRVVLADSHKHHGHVCRVNQTDESSYHVADSIALGDDEAIQGALRAKGRVEVASLSDGVCSNESLETKKVLVEPLDRWIEILDAMRCKTYLANHENLVRLGKLGKFL